MTIATLKMPRLGETMEQGEIVGWLVEIGHAFRRGEPILEVETDKTVVEYPALGSGVLVEILANQGDTVDVGDAIARIDLGTSNDWTNTDQSEPATAIPQETAAQETRVDPAEASGRGDDRLRATPVARKLARDAGVDLSAVTGTGRRGRIEADDIRQTCGDRSPGQTRFAHDIAFYAAGPDSGPQFLLLHGFGGDHTSFAQLVNGLKRAGARSVTCDLPGHGATRIEARTADDLSANLQQFIAAKMSGRRFHLVAHSLGAVPALAQALALTQAFYLASLTLIAPVGLADNNNTDFLTGMASPRSLQQVRQLVNMLTETPGTLSDSAIEDIFAEQSRGRLVELAKNLGAHQQSIIPTLGRLAQSVPVRLLIGQNDQIVGQAVLEGLPPEIAVHFFANTGHMPHWENPQAVLKILTTAMKTNNNQ